MNYRTTEDFSDFHNLFSYADGKLFWKKDVANNVKAGYEVAKNSKVGKYKQASVNRKPYAVHRIIYFLHTGELPRAIDHINGDTKDNRIENLRAATHRQNSMNRKTHKDSKTGIKNVCRSSCRDSWRVSIALGNGKVFDKSFKDLELAEFIATEVRNKYHGEFVNHGRNA